MKALIWLAMGSLVACSSSTDGATTNTLREGVYPCAVQAVIAERCLPCHAETPRLPVTAPFSLETFADTRGTTSLLGIEGQPIWQAMAQVVREGRMPLETKDPYSTPNPLPAEEAAVILAWTDAGAPPAPSGTTCP